MGSSIELRFTRPDTATDGELLTKPIEIEIFREVTSSGSKPNAAAGAEKLPAPLVTLKGAELAHRTIDEKVEYTEQLEPAEFSQWLGSTVTFRVRALTRGFRGRPIDGKLSSVAGLRLLDVSRPVENLAVEETEKALNLRWSAAAETISGRPSAPAGYRIYRSDGRAAPYRRTAETSGTSYADAQFEFGRLYAYKIRAVTRDDGHTAESADSASVEIVPRDVFPPAAPAGLTGLYTGGAVELIWNPGDEPDLAGYNVYRRETAGPPQRLNAELLRSPLYRDTTAMAGRHYIYRVTAVDLRGNESGPSSELQINVPSAP